MQRCSDFIKAKEMEKVAIQRIARANETLLRKQGTSSWVPVVSGVCNLQVIHDSAQTSLRPGNGTHPSLTTAQQQCAIDWHCLLKRGEGVQYSADSSSCICHTHLIASKPACFPHSMHLCCLLCIMQRLPELQPCGCLVPGLASPYCSACTWPCWV